MAKKINTTWTEEETEELWARWLRRSADTKVLFFAEDMGAVLNRSMNSVRGKLNQLIRERAGMIPESNYAVWNHHPRIEGDAFVLLDAHIPFQHADFLNRCLMLCKAWGITSAILGGDALDLHAFNKFPENFEDEEKRVIDSRLQKELIELSEKLPAKYRSELQDKLAAAEIESGNVSEEIRESRVVLQAFANHFERVVWIMGNHEQRITRILEKTLDAVHLARLFGADDPKWEVSGYYWCELMSGGVKWQIEHPINTGKGSSRRLVPKYGCNIIMGHNHHLSLMSDPSGQYLAIEPGMGADESKMGYVQQRHNAMDVHVLGAIIIRDGKPTLLNRFTDWDMLLKVK